MKKALFLIMLLAMICILPAQNQPLTVISPNGGEVWMTGTTQIITWTELNLSGTVNILLLGQDAPAPTVTFIAQGIPVTAGQYSWLIPESIPTADTYRIRVAQGSASGVYPMDFSDAYFTIIAGTDPPPPQTFITVTAPNGGEQWAVGSTQTITWNYGNLEGDVRITLVQEANTPQIVVTEMTPIAAQAFTWTIPSTIPSGQYRMHVQWLGIPAVYWGDVSDGYFSISNGNPPPPPVLTVVSPNGGETWVAGTMHPITWEYTGNGGMVLIQLMGGPEMTPINIIAQNIPANQHIYEWVINPWQMPGNAYQVQISLLDPSGVFIGDISDLPFTITEGSANTPWLTVTSPNGGETWATGTTHEITWNSGNIEGFVYVALIRENMNSILIIGPEVPVLPGIFMWTVPEEMQAGNCMIQVVWITPLDIYVGDISDGFFFITNDNPPPPQAIAVTAPNGGEVWSVGIPYQITWTTTLSQGVAEMTLLGANDPATNMFIITPGIPVSLQTFNWVIPPMIPAGTNYRVQIRVISDGMLLQDMSDAPFTIINGDDPPPQQLVVTAPNGGEHWAKGSTQTITWTDTNPTGNVRIILTLGSHAHARRMVIARNAPNTGTFTWTVPLRLPLSSRYKVVIKKVGGVSDASDGFFSIVAPQNTLKASPNPTHQGTQLTFDLPEAVTASVSIYNLKGQCVRTLVEERTLAGRQTLYWDGNDTFGNKVSAGIYFARISAPEFTSSKKIIVLK